MVASGPLKTLRARWPSECDTVTSLERHSLRTRTTNRKSWITVQFMVPCGTVLESTVLFFYQQKAINCRSFVILFKLGRSRDELNQGHYKQFRRCIFFQTRSFFSKYIFLSQTPPTPLGKCFAVDWWHLILHTLGSWGLMFPSHFLFLLVWPAHL